MDSTERLSDKSHIRMKKRKHSELVRDSGRTKSILNTDSSGSLAGAASTKSIPASLIDPTVAEIVDQQRVVKTKRHRSTKVESVEPSYGVQGNSNKGIIPVELNFACRTDDGSGKVLLHQIDSAVANSAKSLEKAKSHRKRKHVLMELDDSQRKNDIALKDETSCSGVLHQTRANIREKEKRLKKPPANVIEDGRKDTQPPQPLIEPEEKPQALSNHINDTHLPSKGRYIENFDLAALSNAQINAFLKTHFITITDPLSAQYRPIIDFKYLKDANRHKDLLTSFQLPTPIQAAAWPFLFSGRDVIGVAETGSGKTLAFGLPCIDYVNRSTSQKSKPTIKAVVVSPTRELALQIHEQFLKIGMNTKGNVVCIYGGVPKEQQRTALATASIVVATPGRLNDFIQEKSACLGEVGFFVLDEADRMLEKGFENEVRRIIAEVPIAKCQMAMFTATWPQNIRELASTFMKHPVKIAIGDNPAGELRANTQIKQLVEVVEPRDKQTRLLQLIKKYQSGRNSEDRILAFCLYKKEAIRVEEFLRSRGLRVAGIHGDMTQPQRTVNLESFKSGKVPLLVATDVAARGLDIPAVKLVINVTFPLTVEDYVHRIGRTARAGKDGTAITLFTEHDKALSGALINVLKAAKQTVPDELLRFGTSVKKKSHDAYGAFYRDTTGETKKATKIVFD